MSNKAQLVIVGAGPAGLAAAQVAGEMGIDTVLIDEQASAGGQIYRGVQNAGGDLLSILGKEYEHGQKLVNRIDFPTVKVLSCSTVWQISEDGTVYHTGPKGACSLRAEQTILATGAIERPMPFPGWTLPGVMTVGGIQIALKTAGLTPDGEVVLAGSGPLLLLLTRQIIDAGGKISAVVETTPKSNKLAALKHLPGLLKSKKMLVDGLALVRVLRKHNISHYRHATALSAFGDTSVKGLRFVSNGQQQELNCDVLGIHVGVVPNVQITRQLNLTHDWQQDQRCYYPRTGARGETELEWLHIAGDGGGIFGAMAAEYQGTIAACSVAQQLGAIDEPTAAAMIRSAQSKLSPLRSARTFIDTLYSPSPEFLTPPDETIVCRCEEVSAGAIREFVKLGCLGPNQTKSFGRPGMGPCQGRYCGLTVSELIADQRKVPVSEVGYYRIRPPIKPITIAELASLDD